MTRLYIVRHTQTVGNIEKRLTGRKDYEVTEQGKLFVRSLEEKLKDISFDIAYCSTSNRTRKTIQGLVNKNNIKIIENEDLCEMYFGIYDGWKWEDVNKINPQIHKMHVETNEIMGIEKQETSEQVAERMDKAITKIAKDNIGKTILICSHGVAIEAFLRKVSGEIWTEKVQEYSQKNTSINVVDFDEKNEKFSIKKLNYIQHLTNPTLNER